eukprot:symbB.v1.2.011864.t1/scaffold807.1/size160841/9
MAAPKSEEGRFFSKSQVQLLKGAAGVYFFFIWYGRLQEQIFKYKSASGAKFTSVWFLQLLDALVNVAVGRSAAIRVHDALTSSRVNF